MRNNAQVKSLATRDSYDDIRVPANLQHENFP